MNWKKLSSKAADYAADGAAEKTVEFAFTKVGPYRVAGIVAKLLMFAGIAIGVGGYFASAYVGYAGVFYTLAAVVFVAGFMINLVKNFLFNKAKSALKSGVGWAASEVKKRVVDDKGAPTT